MLFQSDYWLASNFSEKTETILDFLSTDEGIKTLVVIEKHISNDTYTILNSLSRDDLDCKIELITETKSYSYENKNSEGHTKTIYVRNSLDDETVKLLKHLTPIFAIFV